MRTDAKICLVVTIGIIAAIIISGRVFHIDTTTALAKFGLVVAIFLPVYVLHRIRINAGVDKARSESSEVVEGHAGRLKELAEVIEDPESFDEEDAKYLDVAKAAKLRGLAEAMKDSDFQKKAAKKYLKAINTEIRSIGQSLDENYYNIREKGSGLFDLGLFYQD